MKHFRHKLPPVTAISLLVIALLCSCELEPASESPLISPDTATVSRIGDTVTLTAVDGYEYSWSLEDETLGRLSSKTGKSTTYTSEFVPKSNSVVQVVKLTSAISSAGTNTALTKTAEAFVTHEAEGTDNTDALIIEPSEVTVEESDIQTFEASGGNGTYTWDLSQESFGTLSTREGNETTYTSLHTATGSVDVQELTVTSGNESFTAVIKHKAENTPEVEIHPSSAIVTSGNPQGFSVTGGNGSTYNWTVGDPTLGNIDPNATGTSETNIVYEGTSFPTNGNSSFSQTITVTSGNSSDTASITQAE